MNGLWRYLSSNYLQHFSAMTAVIKVVKCARNKYLFVTDIPSIFYSLYVFHNLLWIFYYEIPYIFLKTLMSALWFKIVNILCFMRPIHICIIIICSNFREHRHHYILYFCVWNIIYDIVLYPKTQESGTNELK